MSQKYSVLLVGVGSIGQRHLQLLQEHDALGDIIACRRTPTGETGVDEYADISKALATDPAIAFITNPTDLHIETAITCARTGCDLFIEKPLSHSMEGITELSTVVESQKLVTMVGCQLRFSPVLQEVQDLLATETFGQVLSFEAYSGSYLPDWRPNQDYRESYSADSGRGGGVVLDLIHELDYTHWLFGPIDSVSGLTANVSTLEIKSEDLAVMTVDAGPALGTIHLDYARPTPRRTLEVVCEDAVISADLVGQTVTVTTKEWSRTDTYEYTRDHIFRWQLDHFIDAVNERTSPCNDIFEATDVLKHALGVKQGN